MVSLNMGSIRKNLALLVMIAVLPALAILLYTGVEQRRNSIKNAEHDVLLLTHTMAAVQVDIARSTKQILSTLALLPEIKSLDIQTCSEIFRAVLEQNPDYQNITLTNPNGEVVASGLPFGGSNLNDRKHFREALDKKTFAAGEYIVTRVGNKEPAFAFAYPVLDKKGHSKAVLTAAINLTRFSRFYESSLLLDQSFVAITDHQGIRLLYYPPKEATNPIGQPIQPKVWDIASTAHDPGIFIRESSDGVRRIFAFEQVRLAPDEAPYLYVWAGLPESQVLRAANRALLRNLFLLFLIAVGSLGISWLVGKNTLISPINSLVMVTRKFAEGKLDSRSFQTGLPEEIDILTRSFHDMADKLSVSQQTLRENEAQFRLLMDSLDALVYVADMTTYEVLFINKYGKKQLGEVTGKICWQSIHQGQNGPCSFCTNKYLLAEDGNPGAVHTWEFDNKITGHCYYVQDRAIKWLDGRVVRLEVATDITERKRAETKLAEERERLAVTLRSIGDGVITTDTLGRIVLINKVAETLTGWTAAEAMDKPLSEVFNIINETTRQSCINPVEKVLATGEIVGLANHTALIAKDGQERSIADSAAPIRDRASNIIGIVLVFRDVTEQLRTEQELIKVKKLESIGVLAGGIAHDFNNILTAILGNLDLSLLDTNLSEKTQKLLNEAMKASYRARDLTQQLLTFAKGGEPIKETASLAEVIKDSADFVLRGDKVACHYLFPEDLWLVDIDKGQISQVVQNIILNASSAMPEGGIIEVACENVSTTNPLSMTFPQKGNYVQMSIKDTGSGISVNIQDKIFDPYFSTKQQGSGLGLAITHSIVTKHNGRVTVQSVPGEGTTFKVYLPASVNGSVPARKADAVSLNTSTRRLRILVMDDEEMVRDLARKMLDETGHDALLAKDGGEAVQLYQDALDNETPIDLSIMDLTIPGGMGGQEAVQKVLEINPNAKVIVSSGYSNDPVMANFKDYGFCAALLKPFRLLEFTKMINQLISR